MQTFMIARRIFAVSGNWFQFRNCSVGCWRGFYSHSKYFSVQPRTAIFDVGCQILATLSLNASRQKGGRNEGLPYHPR